MNIAQTILEQLGNNKFITMTGARQFIALPSGLQFKLPGGGGFCKQGINCVQIILDPSDTYTMKFMKIRSLTVKTLAEHSGIYFDQLQTIFTRETGLDTHL